MLFGLKAVCGSVGRIFSLERFGVRLRLFRFSYLLYSFVIGRYKDRSVDRRTDRWRDCSARHIIQCSSFFSGFCQVLANHGCIYSRTSMKLLEAEMTGI